jgi:RecA/RadA recombinase
MAGGWPMGEMSEIVGPVSSGRTAVLWASLAAATTRGQFVAVVDGLDSFDPRTATEMGMDLARVLWIRGTPVAGKPRAAVRSSIVRSRRSVSCSTPAASASSRSTWPTCR